MYIRAYIGKGFFKALLYFVNVNVRALKRQSEGSLSCVERQQEFPLGVQN